MLPESNIKVRNLKYFREVKKERFDAITDAVFAIILTLMVLEIKLPEFTRQNVPRILQQLFVYGLSFVTIAIYWLNHHNMFVHSGKIGMDLVWINFFLLFAASLIPLATERLSSEFYETESHIFYGSVNGMAALLYSVLQNQEARQRNVNLKASVHLTNWFGTALYFISIPLSFINVYLSTAVFVMMPTLYFFISRKPQN